MSILDFHGDTFVNVKLPASIQTKLTTHIHLGTYNVTTVFKLSQCYRFRKQKVGTN